MSGLEREVLPLDNLAQEFVGRVWSLPVMKEVERHIAYRNKVIFGAPLRLDWNKADPKVGKEWQGFVEFERDALSGPGYSEYCLDHPDVHGSIELLLPSGWPSASFEIRFDLPERGVVQVSSYLGQASFAAPKVILPENADPMVQAIITPRESKLAQRRANQAAFRDMMLFSSIGDGEEIFKLIDSLGEKGKLVQPSSSLMEYQSFLELTQRLKEGIDDGGMLRKGLDRFDWPVYAGSANPEGMVFLHGPSRLAICPVAVKQEEELVGGVCYLWSRHLPFLEGAFGNPTFLNNLV